MLVQGRLAGHCCHWPGLSMFNVCTESLRVDICTRGRDKINWHHSLAKNINPRLSLRGCLCCPRSSDRPSKGYQAGSFQSSFNKIWEYERADEFIHLTFKAHIKLMFLPKSIMVLIFMAKDLHNVTNEGICREFLFSRDWIVVEELINCLFLQRTFLSNFPQSLSASEHTTDIHHPLSDSRNLSSSARCVYCALCPHPHLTDSVRVCFTACERVTVILVSGEETGSGCYVTGNGTGCTQHSRAQSSSVSQLSWWPGPGRAGPHTHRAHLTLCCDCDNSFEWIAGCKHFKDGA